MLFRHLLDYSESPGLHFCLPEAAAAACCLMQCCIAVCSLDAHSQLETVLNAVTEVKLILYLAAANYSLYLSTRLTSRS